jgi:hypothetical protein
MESSLFVSEKKPPYVPSLTPRPPYFLARVVNSWESNVQLVYSSITSLFLLSPFLPARWYPRTIFYDLFKKKSWKSEGEVGGRKGERERVSEPRATVYRQTSRPKPTKRLDHEHQISIVLTLFFWWLVSKTSDGDMLMSLFPSFPPCVLY